MATLYIASTETFVGKSAVCIGLLDRAHRDGFAIGYMKPVSVSVTRTDDAVLDEDAAFIREHFDLADPLDRIAPVLVTQSVIESILRGQSVDFSRRLRDAYVSVSRDKDLVVLEGANTWAEGSIVDLSADHVSDTLQAPVLLVTRYRTLLSLDAILAVQRYLGDRLIGVLINQIETPKLDFVRSRVVPFLQSRGIPVFATLAEDAQLAGVTVADLYEFLGGQIIGNPAWNERLVEHMLIGAMGVEAALSHFRRRANKAVITGGDRTDLQLAALETSTSVLVLTGNLRPVPQVIDRAEERQVPIIFVPDDTLSTVERAESVFGHVRFKQQAKLTRFISMLDESFDFARLYDTLGLPRT
ncbi:MAG TPA: phosphotransacetylase family protein [Roseiflexaceae bacterium]|nr:phosphotransacetylase family protein [Roseiflexaceae bacterium]HMP43029.1 phosphotransacetylase family protein [Roseiflexaceae bacterium]